MLILLHWQDEFQAPWPTQKLVWANGVWAAAHLTNLTRDPETNSKFAPKKWWWNQCRKLHVSRGKPIFRGELAVSFRGGYWSFKEILPKPWASLHCQERIVELTLVAMGTPWKTAGSPTNHHVFWRGTSSEPNPHDFGFQPLTFNLIPGKKRVELSKVWSI